MFSKFTATYLLISMLLSSMAFALSEPNPGPKAIEQPVTADAPIAEQAQEAQPQTPKDDDLALKLVENDMAVGQADLSPEKVEASRALTLQVAVYSLEFQNVPEGIGRVVSDALLAKVRKIEGISAIGMEEVTQMISMEAQKQMMGSEASESCLAQIAGALGVDELITGTLTELADGRVLMIRRIDQRKAKVIEAVQERLKIGSGEEFLLAIGPSVEKLYAGRPYPPGTTPRVPDELVLRLNAAATRIHSRSMLAQQAARLMANTTGSVFELCAPLLSSSCFKPIVPYPWAICAGCLPIPHIGLHTLYLRVRCQT